jgi:hypothetical protein
MSNLATFTALLRERLAAVSITLVGAELGHDGLRSVWVLAVRTEREGVTTLHAPLLREEADPYEDPAGIAARVLVWARIGVRPGEIQEARAQGRREGWLAHRAATVQRLQFEARGMSARARDVLLSIAADVERESPVPGDVN